MLTDWTHWISSLHPDQLLLALLPLLMFDSTRYALGTILCFIGDCLAGMWAWLAGRPQAARFSHCPSVCAIIAGLNEADTLDATLHSLWGSYPQMEIVVVDDGSSDGMSAVARSFAARHAGVQVMRRVQRGGKSSALNQALSFTRAEIVVCVDGDSHLGPNAVWEIVQPFQDPAVGAVSGSVAGRNAFGSLCAWLQSLEFLRCIFLGRMFSARVGALGIVSGAFGAYRGDVLRELKGWDVGPGEDGDLTLRIRKAGYQVAFAPYAECMTNLPQSFWQLIKQRRRWEWAVVTFECRKHVDLGDPRSPNFRGANLLLALDRWTFNLLLQFAFWGYLCWLVMHPELHLVWLFLLDYAVFLLLDVLQHGLILYYSNHRRRDLLLGLAIPLMPLYYLLLRSVLLWAVVEELLTRRSHHDNFVPAHVRQRTWHW